MKRSKILILLFVVFLFSFLFFGVKSSYGIYRDTLNTTVDLTVANPSGPFTISFDSHGGGSFNPVVGSYNQPIGTLPTPSKTGYNFIGWFTLENGGTQISASTLITGDYTYHAHYVQIVCKKAQAGTLHTETCSQSTITGCLASGNQQNSTLTYGTIPGSYSPLPGDAYDCDVNNDGVYNSTNERFYFIREDTTTDKAVLVHYTNIDENGQTSPQRNGDVYLYNDGIGWLPDSTVWSNSLLSNIDGHVARYPSLVDLESACGVLAIDSDGYMDNCNYFMENSKYQSDSGGNSTLWVQSGTNNYRIDTRTRSVNELTITTSNAVRPVIEIPFSSLEGYQERNTFTITFDSEGGTFQSLGGVSTYSVTRYENQTLGALPVPVKTDNIFDGWYDANYVTEVNNTDLATANVTYHAKWISTANYVAEVNGTYYTTLQSAISSVPTNNNKTVVTLLKNTTGKMIVSTGQYIEFDFQTYTLSNASASAIENNGKIEIKNGTVSSASSSPAILNKSGATLNISGGTVSSTNNNAIKSHGVTNITGGTITTSAATSGALDVESGGNVTISGGTVSSTGNRQAAYNNGGTLTITGTAYMHNVTNERAAVQNHIGTLYITGGTIIAENFSGVYNEGTLTIGVNDGVVSTTTPVIQGNPNGVLIKAGESINFYDGIIKGTTAAISDETATITVSTSTITHGSETIDSVTYDTAYLVSSLVTYTVSFDAHEGTASFNYKTVASGSAIGELPTASKIGYILDGWYTAPTGGRKIDSTEVINSADTFHAQYLPASTVTFDPDGGTASFLTKAVATGSSVGELPTVTKANYNFVGWYDTSYTNLIDPTTIVNGDVTFVAKWVLAESVAEFDGVYYTSLQAAVDCVPTNNTKKVITLLKDTNENIVIGSGKNIEFDLQNFTISNTAGRIIDNSGTIEIKNGTLLRTGTNDQMRVIENQSSGTVVISGGEIKSNAFQAIRNYGTLTITGGKIWIGNSVDQGVINNESTGTMTISGGEVIATKRQAIYNDGGTLTVTGTASLKNASNSNRACLQNNAGTVTITGGNIVSNTSSYPAVLNNATMTIGVDDGTISTTTPVIKGEGYGLVINSGKTVNFYDGIIKGKNAAVIDNESRVVLDQQNGVTIVHDTEVIDGVTYNTAYLNAAVSPQMAPFVPNSEMSTFDDIMGDISNTDIEEPSDINDDQ